MIFMCHFSLYEYIEPLAVINFVGTCRLDELDSYIIDSFYFGDICPAYIDILYRWLICLLVLLVQDECIREIF